MTERPLRRRTGCAQKCRSGSRSQSSGAGKCRMSEDGIAAVLTAALRCNVEVPRLHA